MSIDIRNTVIEQEMKDVAIEESGFISDDDNDDDSISKRYHRRKWSMPRSNIFNQFEI